MRISLLHSCAAAVLLVTSAGSAVGQGLLAVQNYSADFRSDQPLTWSFVALSGYDNLDFAIEVPPFVQDIESWFIQGGVGVTYTDADKTTPWSTSVDFNVIHYLEGASRFDDIFINARAAFNLAHQFSERLRIANNFYFAHEVEPNLAAGASTVLFNGEYLYGFNNFNVSYAWSKRFSTVTSYTIDGVFYDDDTVSGLEDRLSHLVSQQFVYQATKRTSAVAEYRFRWVDFQNRDDVDYQSHFALAGIDHAWSERLTGSVRAGAEFFESDRSSQVAPYAETALEYDADRKTQVRWFAALGFDAAEIGAFQNRYSARTGLNVNHQVNKRFRVNGGASYVYSIFDQAAGDVVENSVLLSAGIGYQIWENVGLDAQYSFSVLDSDDATWEFDRHRVTLGLNASF
jgi:hypothetical protein